MTDVEAKAAIDAAASAASEKAAELAKPVEKAAEPAKISVDPAEYTNTWRELETLRQFKAQSEAQSKAAIDAARQESLAKLAESQGAKVALEEQAKQLRAEVEAERLERTTLDREVMGEKKANALATGIGSFAFHSDDARDQVLAILAPRFDVKREDGAIVVRDVKTGRLAADLIPELLNSKAFEHFKAPKGRTGTGAEGGDKPAPTVVDQSDPQAVMLAALKVSMAKRKSSFIGISGN